jgi:hypothetical protein
MLQLWNGFGGERFGVGEVNGFQEINISKLNSGGDFGVAT